MRLTRGNARSTDKVDLRYGRNIDRAQSVERGTLFILGDHKPNYEAGHGLFDHPVPQHAYPSHASRFRSTLAVPALRGMKHAQAHPLGIGRDTRCRKHGVRQGYRR